MLVAVLFEPLLALAVKPQSPLQVIISPVQPALSALDIKPGDALEFKITGKTNSNTQNLNIKVELHDGVEMVTGNSSWQGAAQKGEEKTFLITVRAPVQGGGWITAKISMSPSSGASFAAEAEYHFGKDMASKPALKPKPNKDRKRRNIKEYQAN